MKIAILVGLFPPKWLGGIELATYNSAKYLAIRGHEVHVITTLDEGMPKESIEEGFCVHRILRRNIRLLGAISLWINMVWLLKNIKPDIVHAQSVGIGIPAYLSKKFLGNKYVVQGHGSDIYLSWFFKKPISKLVFKNADAVIALTEDMKLKMKKNCDGYVITIPNGIDLEKFENLERMDNCNQNVKTILFVGSLRPVKGVKYLIEAMKIINKKCPNTRLVLVGDGEERTKLEGYIEELGIGKCTCFIGKVPNEDIPKSMAASDVFVLPSLSESFGIVNLEAMASGLPIVATNVGGLPEIVKDGINGFLVEPKNPEQISERVLLVLGDNVLREKISKNNKERAKEYSWKNVVDKLEGIYQSLFEDK